MHIAFEDGQCVEALVYFLGPRCEPKAEWSNLSRRLLSQTTVYSRPSNYRQCHGICSLGSGMMQSIGDVRRMTKENNVVMQLFVLPCD